MIAAGLLQRRLSKAVQEHRELLEEGEAAVAAAAAQMALGEGFKLYGDHKDAYSSVRLLSIAIVCIARLRRALEVPNAHGVKQAQAIGSL